MKFKVLKKSTKQWGDVLKQLAKNYREMNDMLHQIAVSVLAHAAQHGDVRPLNAFFEMMSINHQTSFRAWVGRIFAKAPETQCLRYSSDDGFSIIVAENNNPVSKEKERRALQSLCEKRLINPDGKQYARFYERDIRDETAYIFGDADLLKALRSLIRRAEGKQANTTTKVSKDLIPALHNLETKVEQHVVH